MWKKNLFGVRARVARWPLTKSCSKYQRPAATSGMRVFQMPFSPGCQPAIGRPPLKTGCAPAAA